MAYDRYDTERGRDHSRRSHDDNRSRRDERGFFERAGDEIASWFGDDNDDDRGRRSHRGESSGWSAAEHGWGGNPEDMRGRDRDRGEWRSARDDNWGDRGSARPMNWSSSDRDYRSESERGGYSRFGDDDNRDLGSRERGWSGGSGSDRDRTSSGAREGGYRPMTGDYGRSEDRGGYGRSDSPWGRDDYRRTSYAGSNRDNDRHYNAWRQRQLDELDRDYDEYHRERQEHFEKDFGGWRENRQQKRQMVSQAREHMDVVGSDGERIGKVDRIAGDRIVLTKSDSPDGRHHSIPCTMVDKIEDDRIVLDCKAEDAQRKWRDDDRERALFERDDQGDSGPHTLERSFSGTYR